LVCGFDVFDVRPSSFALHPGAPAEADERGSEGFGKSLCIVSTDAYRGFTKSIERAKTLLEVHTFLTKERGRPPKWASDILRATLVFVMASWDSYVHDVVHQNCFALLQKLKGKGLPKKLLEAMKEAVPYEKLLETWHEEKPSVRISTAIRKRNAERTFMKPDKAADALQMVGLDNAWRTAARAMNRRQDGLRKTIEGYARRRDKIAHEGDVGKATRTKGKLASIRRPYVVKALADVQAVVRAIDDVIERTVRA
jgi:hypothetical protein